MAWDKESNVNEPEETQEEQSPSEETQEQNGTDDLFHKFYLFGLGLRKDIEETVSKLIDRGSKETEEKEKAIDELVKKAKERTGSIENKLEGLVNRALTRMNLVTKDRFEALEKRVAELEKKFRE